VVSDERALATWLQGRDDAALAATFTVRGISPAATWSDFFDAADALLDAASVDRALARLPRRALHALLTADASAPTHIGTEWALLDDAGLPYTAVRERVAQAAETNPSAFTPDPSVTEPPAAGPDQEAAAAEHAFTTLGSLADVLLACVHAPLGRTSTGAISAVDRKRLIDTGAVTDGEVLDDLVTSAAGAGLAAAGDRLWEITAAGEAWLEQSTGSRWQTVAAAFRDALPAGLRAADGTVLPVTAWADAYPLDHTWPARAENLRRVATRWGFLTRDGSEPSWTRVLRTEGRVDAAPLVAHLPAEIDRVYLQADLTAIAPGPLAPHLDLRLRRIATRESRAQASTYRFTAGSLGSGMTEGESADSIRSFLTGLSLTGIPQPLEYLIESTAARHGLVRVQQEAETGRTRITTPDAALRDTIAVDQALRPLGLVRDGDGLASRVMRDAVYWSLADARYPVVALDESGAPESLHRRTHARAGAPLPTPVEVYARVIASLRAGHDTEGDAGWLERELDQAVRARATIVVTVRLPDDSERAFTLEATGLGGGRLRGRDRGADIERTLPVSSITAIRAPG
jgi:hypothetical protein